MVNQKSRLWNLVLYPKEDNTHYHALEIIKKNYDYACINHNRDYNNKNELKKDHVHCIIKLPNARYQNALALELGILPNYMEKCRNLENSLKYLIHFGIENKTQYSIEEVEGNLKNKLEQILDSTDLDINEQLLEILKYIQQYHSYLSMSDFLTYICSTPLLSTYRKFAYSINQVINEHNLYYTNYNKKST